MFKIKIISPNNSDVCKKIEADFPGVALNKDCIQIKMARIVLDVMHFLLSEGLDENKFELEIEGNAHSINIDDYSQVRNDVEDLWAKEIEDSTTIFDSSLSIDERRKLLKKVNKSSRFYESYEEYLNEIAIYLAEKIVKETVILNDVMDEYSIKSDVQRHIPRNSHITHGPDFRLYPLDIHDLEKIVDLINKIKRE